MAAKTKVQLYIDPDDGDTLLRLAVNVGMTVGSFSALILSLALAGEHGKVAVMTETVPVDVAC